MKKPRKIVVILVYVLIVALAAACIALFLVQTANNGWKFDATNAAKFGVILLGLIFTAVKMTARLSDGPSLKKYESLYQKEIGSAFSKPDHKKEKRILLKAIACYNQNQYNKAINKLKSLQKGCHTRDDYAAVLLFLAVSYAESGLTDNAIAAYEELVERVPNYSTAWSNLGMLYRKEGKHDKAIHAIESAIRCDEANAYAWNNLAQIHLSVNNWQKVIAPALRALELNTQMYQAETALTVAYYAMGDAENSKKYFNSAITHGASAQKLASVLHSLTYGAVTFGNTDDVREEVTRAVGHLERDTSLPMVEIRLPAPNDGNRSRLGGRAIDHTVPLDSVGNPMKLLAAIWCSEVRGVPNFPERGVLRFYVADNDLYGADFDHPTEQRDFRVLYDENEDGFDTTQRDADDLSESFPIPHVLPIRLTPALGSIRSSDYRFRDCLNAALAKVGVDSLSDGVDSLSDDEFDFIYEQNVYAGHRIGGYPCFEQYDPRENHPEYQAYDTLLLQIVSHTVSDENHHSQDLIMFGDEGGCQFFIPSEKLKNRDFSDVLFWWDCG